MIRENKAMNRILEFGFRLLNSEIGNDLSLYAVLIVRKRCFRLLNSEIGNDQKLASHSRERRLGFRLLNSEIGNDHFQ